MDIYLLPLVRQNGQIRPDLPGLEAPPPPKRAARGRRTDRVVIYCSFAGAPLPRNEYDKLVKQLGSTFYQAPGSVTAALKATAEKLNQVLLDFNQQRGSTQQPTIGQAGLLAVRGEQVFMALCGPVHAYVLQHARVQHMFDPQTSRRGLGLGRTTPIFYAKTELKPGENILLSPEPPPVWTEATLRPYAGEKIERLHQQLIQLAGTDLKAVLLQAARGKGEVHLIRARPIPRQVTREIQPREHAMPSTPPSRPTGRDGHLPTPPAPAPVQDAAPEKKNVPPQIHEAARPEPVQQTTESPPEPTRQSMPEAQIASQRRRPALPFKKTAAALARAVAVTLDQFRKSFGTLLRRMVPDEHIFDIPPGVMVFSAIAIPLIVVAITSVIYLRSGRAGQFEVYYIQALQAAKAARVQTDPQERRKAWNTVNAFLDQAEAYTTSQGSIKLRQEAREVLDQLDIAIRLPFQPAIAGGLPSSVRVKRILATESELYMLDGEKGMVYRAFFAGNGYELDTTFQCSTSFTAGGANTKLVDIILQSTASEGGSKILGLDSAGNLLHCHQGLPLSDPLTPPATGWKNPQAMAFAQSNLYILDPEANAVWIYWNSDFSQEPTFFFGEQPPEINDVVDIAIDKDDLLLLHVDGQLTVCTYSGLEVAPTQCDDPAPYIDMRPGSEELPLFPTPGYQKLFITQPPDPSLYILEPAEQAIHHYSLRLTYQRQIRPAEPLVPEAPLLDATATAFALRPDNRFAFLAIGNTIYYAGIP